jgi:hypothetical protein
MSNENERPSLDETDHDFADRRPIRPDETPVQPTIDGNALPLEATNSDGSPIVDWGTNVGRPSMDDDVAALAAASRTPEALLKGSPEVDEPGQPQDGALGVSDAQALRVLMVERAAKVLVDLAERPAFGRRAAVSLDDVLELADYYIGDEDDDRPNEMEGQSPSFVTVDEGKRFFDQMTEQAAFRPTAQERQAQTYRGGLFHTMMSPGASHPRSATGGREATFGDLLDALLGKPVQANIRVEELQVGDLVTSHGDKVLGQPTWDGRAERWVIDMYCPKRDEAYTHRAKVDDKVDIYNERIA